MRGYPPDMAMYITNDGRSGGAAVQGFSPALLSSGGELITSTSQTLVPNAPVTFFSCIGIAYDANNDLWLGTWRGQDITPQAILKYTRESLKRGATNPDVIITLPASATGHSGTVAIDGIISIKFDSGGNLWALDHSGVLLKYTPAQIAATGSPSPSVVITIADTATLYNMYGTSQDIAIDSSGNIYWSLWTGEANSGFFRLSAAQVASSGTAIDPSAVFTGTNINTRGQTGMALDSANNRLWIGDYNLNSVSAWNIADLAAGGNPAPVITLTAGSDDFSGPQGLLLDADGNLWVTNYNDSTVNDAVRVPAAQLGASGVVTPNLRIRTGFPRVMYMAMP